ncbi:MAG: tRNA dihydrouridine synthase DusB [Bradymonadales bacterium]|nr:MAG: tRNA dihydrouridine synthase DusB [Bradymonadales bacterium]
MSVGADGPLATLPKCAKGRFDMRLGPFEIEHPFILAPMAGITNSPHRRLMRRFGSSLVVSELISANGLQYRSPRTEELLSFHKEESPVGIQIFGERQEALVEACQWVERLGVDFVDLNLGCPVRKVVSKGAGCALTRDPERLFVVLREMKSSIQIPLTIKIRTGWDANEINAAEVIDAATRAGVSWVAVHGRTRAQGYEGSADWELIAELKSQAKIPVIGNGDIKTPEDATKRLRESGVDAVMIGRAALRNPFIFRQASDLLRSGRYQEPSLEDYLELFENQKSLLQQGSERLALLQSKKFIAWYAAGYPHSHALRRELFELQDFDQVWSRAHEYFSCQFGRRESLYLTESFLMGGHG